MTQTTSASKFNVSNLVANRTYKGVLYDSILEMRYFKEVIEPLIESGYIDSYERQKPYILQASFRRPNGTLVRAITYVADFVIRYSNGIEEVVDIKGMPTQDAKIKRKLFWAKYPDVEYKWISYNKKHGGWVDYDDLQKKIREDKRIKESGVKGE